MTVTNVPASWQLLCWHSVVITNPSWRDMHQLTIFPAYSAGLGHSGSGALWRGTFTDLITNVTQVSERTLRCCKRGNNWADCLTYFQRTVMQIGRPVWVSWLSLLIMNQLVLLFADNRHFGTSRSFTSHPIHFIYLFNILSLFWDISAEQSHLI